MRGVYVCTENGVLEFISLEEAQEYLDKQYQELVEEARKHHAKHGDMDGHTCLLAECELHYPKSKFAVCDER